MAKITVTVPDDVYEAARLRAAEAHTTVSALSRDYLIRVAAQGSTYERLLFEREVLLTQIDERSARYDAGQRLARDDAHDRDAPR